MCAERVIASNCDIMKTVVASVFRISSRTLNAPESRARIHSAPPKTVIEVINSHKIKVARKEASALPAETPGNFRRRISRQRIARKFTGIIRGSRPADGEKAREQLSQFRRPCENDVDENLPRPPSGPQPAGPETLRRQSSARNFPPAARIIS